MSYLKKGKYLAVLIVLGLLTIPLFNTLRSAFGVSAYSPTVLIVSNDDTYNAAGVTGGTSATQMQSTLTGAGYSVTVWVESANSGVPPTVATAQNYDLVIFTQGVGYRSTVYGKQGLNTDDLTFLRNYVNGGGRLIMEGEDVLTDITSVGTTTDRQQILKINASSSRSNRGKITTLRSTAGHPVTQGLASTVAVTYQTSRQDSIVGDTGSAVVINANYSGTSTIYGAVNTWDGGNGSRLVYMPFAWYVNTSNYITDAAWRNTFLLNSVKWLGEKTLTVVGENRVPIKVPPNTAGIVMEKVTLTSSSRNVYLNGITVSEMGSAAANTHVAAVKIYDDANNNGLLDGGETLLGSSTFAPGQEVATINFNSAPMTVAYGSSKNLLIVYDIGDVPNDTTIGASLAAISAVVLHPDDLLTSVSGGFPISSNLTSVYSAGTAEIDSPLNNDVVAGTVNITGSSSSGYTLYFGLGSAPSGWTQISTSGTGVSNGTLGTWNSASVAGGWYTLRLVNSTSAVDSIFVDVDNQGPYIEAGPSTSGITNRQATVTWTTDEPSTSKVEYKRSADVVYTAVTDTALVTQHSLNITNLTGATNYDVRVVSVDAVGNSTTSSVIGFTSLQDGAVGAVTVPVAGGKYGGEFAVNGTAKTTNPNPGASVQWSLAYGQGSTPGAVDTWITMVNNSTTPVDAGTLYNWDSQNLNGSYILRLVVTDPSLSGSTATVTKYVSFTLDNRTPEISDISVKSITNTTSIISWNTDKPSTGQLSYRINGGTYGVPISDSDADKQVFLSGLQPNTLYFFKIEATDNFGHLIVSGERSFTTANITDSILPNPPTGVTGTGRTENKVELAWKPGSDNTGIAAYNIYRSVDGVSYVYLTIVPGNKLTFTDTGLNAGTKYYYKVTSLDLAGNESTQASSTAVAVSTVGNGRTNPHGSYPKLTDTCGKCHITHRGLKTNLFKDTQEQKVCFVCHNGTGSQYDVQTEYQPSHTSRHPLPMEVTGKECASCHNPHLSSASTPRLLNPQKLDGSGSVNSGSEVCMACHGDGVVNYPAMADDVAGSKAAFATSIHNISPKMPNPPSGTQIKCVNCHLNHSSDNVRLTRAKEEENCYQCHSKRPGAPPVPDIEDLFKLTSRHKISDTDQATDGSKVECVNCHNPHEVTDTNKISDPNNTLTVWTGDITNFCIQCHKAGPYPQKTVSQNTLVPYTVVFPNLTFTSNAGGWDKAAFVTTGSTGHYNPTAPAVRLECTTCHDPHGTPNTWLTRYFEESACIRCHDGGTTGAADINGLLAKTWQHKSLETSNVHQNTETIAGVARHSECVDCHDPHTVRGGGATEVDVLGKVSGVNYTTTGWDGNWANWATQTTANSVFLDPVTNNRQAYLCYKCHSKAAGTLPTSPSGGFQETDAAREFNPSNKARHVVEGTSQIPTFTYNSVTYYYGKFVNGWTATSNVKCSDCHASNTGTVKGPHGSDNAFILKKPWRTNAPAQSGDLCFDCHDYGFYASGTNSGSTTVRSQYGNGSNYNYHQKHSGSKQVNGCASCHGGLPHGWNHTDSAGNGLALFGSDDPRPYKDGSFLSNVQVNANRTPGAWNSQHSGTSCGSTGGCT